MRQIGRGIYAETGYRGGNVGFVVTSEGVILINTPLSPPEARQWREKIAGVTDQKVIYVINTDYHPECVVGNHIFGAPVIAHELAWKKMKSYGDAFRRHVTGRFEDEPEVAAELERLRIVTPRITFTDKMDLHKGNKELKLVHVGAHTPASIIVCIPGDGVLFAGDVVVNGVHPLIMGEANSKEWLNALTYIRRPWVKAEIIVPGEGEICGKEVTEELSRYIRRLRARMRGAYSTGRSRAESVASVAEMIDFFPVADGEEGQAKQRFKANAEQVYGEMKARGEG